MRRPPPVLDRQLGHEHAPAQTVFFDITRELTGCTPYPGDPSTALTRLCSPEKGDIYTLSSISMSLHSGTHMDAPLHFIHRGGDASNIPLSSCIGPCLLVEKDALMDLWPGSSPLRLLLRGQRLLTEEERVHLTALSPALVGTDQPSIGAPDAEAAGHIPLLKKGTVILENLDLSGLAAGSYRLIALPMKISGAEAAPCRAILLPPD